MHTVPATKRPSPSQDFNLSFSFKTKTEKKNGQKDAEFIDRDDDAHLSLGDRIVIAKPRTRRGKAG